MQRGPMKQSKTDRFHLNRFFHNLSLENDKLDVPSTTWSLGNLKAKEPVIR